MTTATDGSVDASARSAGNPDTATGAAVNGSTDAPATLFAGLRDEGNRDWLNKKGMKSEDDFVTSYRGLETKLGNSFTKPADDAKPEEWDKIYSKLGRPEKAEAYEFKRPDGLPADLPYDEGFANVAKDWFFEAGANGKQAQVLHDKFVGWQAEQAKAHVTALTEAVEATADDLVKEWGPQDSDGFKTKHEMANRAIKKLELVDSFKKSGIILSDGNLTDPKLAKAFAVIGEKMFSDDSIDGAGGSGGKNPFKDDTFSLSEISTLVKSDPDTARRLAREAGKNPDEWVGRKR